MSDLSRYDWLVVTSPNGARRAMAALRDARDLAGVRLAAVGPGRRGCWPSTTCRSTWSPSVSSRRGCSRSFPDPPAGGGRILLARAEVAREVLPEGLRARGWEVDVVDAYRTVPVPLDAAAIARCADADAITFTSASSVTNFVAAAGARRRAAGRGGDRSRHRGRSPLARGGGGGRGRAAHPGRTGGGTGGVDRSTDGGLGSGPALGPTARAVGGRGTEGRRGPRRRLATDPRTLERRFVRKPARPPVVARRRRPVPRRSVEPASGRGALP